MILLLLLGLADYECDFLLNNPHSFAIFFQVQASSLNSAVIDLDSDDDSNVHNEVTSESVDDTILEDDDDVVFISYDKLNEKTDDGIDQLNYFDFR